MTADLVRLVAAMITFAELTGIVGAGMVTIGAIGCWWARHRNPVASIDD